MEKVECFCTFSPKRLSKLTSIKSKTKLGSNSNSNSSSSSSSPKTAATPPRSALREKELREVFRRFDSDSDGKISPAELRSHFAAVGEYMSYEEAEGIISHLDSDNDKLLDFQDFLRLMEGGGEREEDLRAAFGIFECSDSGRITARSLQRVLGQLGDKRSYEECVAMIRVFDSDGKGEIGYDEFQQMMTAA